MKSGRSIRGAVALAVAVGSLGAACSFTLNFKGIDDGVRDAASDADLDTGFTQDAPSSVDSGPPPFDASVDVNATSDDAQSTVDASAVDATDGPCGNLPGPAMVQVSNFCIDSTEVTIDNYAGFLAAKAGDVSGQIPICSWNTSLVPGGGLPTTNGSVSVANVNWCQAYAYCQWAGKHLCGAPDGGAGDHNRWGDPVDSAWFHTCSRNNDGLHTYPYGNAYHPTVCDGQDYGADAALPAVTSCVGGFSGVYDMSGNLWEWEDRCWPVSDDAGLVGPGDFCFGRGGAFTETSGSLTCGVGVGFTRGGQGDNIGFRCCSP